MAALDGSIIESMSGVDEIEAAISGLPEKDFFRLHAWMKKKFEDQWDRQLREDAEAGRLDHLAEEALTEYHAGATKPFPPDEKRGEQ